MSVEGTLWSFVVVALLSIGMCLAFDSRAMLIGGFSGWVLGTFINAVMSLLRNPNR